MTLLHAKGNLLDMAENGDFHIIVQGCNCWNRMKKGIAKEIAARYPEVVRADNMTVEGDGAKLGHFTFAPVTRKGRLFLVVNAYTQYFMNKKGFEQKDRFEYEAFDRVLNELLEKYPGVNFGFPYIGMGWAKGDPERIMASLNNFADKMTATGGTVTLVEWFNELERGH